MCCFWSDGFCLKIIGFSKQGHDLTLRMRWTHAHSLFEGFENDGSRNYDDLHEAIATLQEIEPIARRVLGGAHPLASAIGESLRNSRDVEAALRDIGAALRDLGEEVTNSRAS